MFDNTITKDEVEKTFHDVISAVAKVVVAFGGPDQYPTDSKKQIALDALYKNSLDLHNIKAAIIRGLK